MKLFQPGAARFIIAALATMMAGSAFGAEQLLMPYACRMQGGEVRLAPAADTFYRIHGVRDKQVFSACSPDNPNRCRNWLLHRFDLDCGGVRVGWMKVVEAVARADRLRAWVDAGRMSIAMGPYWTVAREGPVYGRGSWRRPPPDDGPPGFAARRRGADIVVLPPGYAPVLSTGARFLAGPTPEIARAPAPAEPEPLPPPVKKSEVLARAPASVKENAAAGLGAAPNPVRDGAGVGSGATSSTSSNAGDSASTSAAGKAVTATIINKPGAAATVASPPPANGAGAQPGTPSAPAAPPAAEKTSEPGQIATGSLQERADPDGRRTQLAVFGAATAALLLVSLVFWSRRGRVRVAELARDPARVSLGGLGRSGGLVPLARAEAGAVPGDPLSRPAPASPPGLPAAQLVMPTTVAEALVVIGASGGAAPEVVKKIVDGLRQSWHPDLARSDADRAHREQRMAQINVAWDILSGRQSA